MFSRECSPSGRGVASAARKGDTGSSLARERGASADVGGTTFRSVLAPPSDGEDLAESSEAPAFFPDLNLDQIVASITAGKHEYNLAPFFYQPLKTVEGIEYRQDVMRDLEDPSRFDVVDAFTVSIKSVRDHITQAGKLHYKYQKHAWLLDAAELYCGAVQGLLCALRASPIMRSHSST